MSGISLKRELINVHAKTVIHTHSYFATLEASFVLAISHFDTEKPRAVAFFSIIFHLTFYL